MGYNAGAESALQIVDRLAAETCIILYVKRTQPGEI